MANDLSENFQELKIDTLFVRGDNKQKLDWFILYKLGTKSGNKIFSCNPDGKKYMYIANPCEALVEPYEWTSSEMNIDHQQSMLANTLKPLYKNAKQYSWIIYSDEPPDGKATFGTAHARGVIAMDYNRGFLLMHSISKFPNSFKNEIYTFDSNDVRYNDFAICVSFDAQKEGNNILHHLRLMNINIYDHNDAKVMEDNSLFENLTTKKHKFEIESIMKTKFELFSKKASYGKDLFADFISEENKYHKLPLLVQTYPTAGPLPLLSQHAAQNIIATQTQIKQPISRDNYARMWTQDHSKWAISNDRNIPYIVFADLNRVESQCRRGGGAIAMQNEEVWQQLKEQIIFCESIPDANESETHLSIDEIKDVDENATYEELEQAVKILSDRLKQFKEKKARKIKDMRKEILDLEKEILETKITKA